MDMFFHASFCKFSKKKKKAFTRYFASYMDEHTY